MKTHHGSCHCGAVTFDVTADINKAITCNCSHCAQKALTLSFIPEEQFELKSGGDNLSEYRFNTKHIGHQFCKTCGVQPFAKAAGPDGKETVAVNLRCIPDLDQSTLSISEFDGKNM